MNTYWKLQLKQDVLPFIKDFNRATILIKTQGKSEVTEQREQLLLRTVKNKYPVVHNCSDQRPH